MEAQKAILKKGARRAQYPPVAINLTNCKYDLREWGNTLRAQLWQPAILLRVRASARAP